MKNVSLSIVLMYHLSDLQTGLVENPSHRINFIKFLIMKYDKENENVLGRFFEIDPDADYKEFLEKHPVPEPEKEQEQEVKEDDEATIAFENAIASGRLSRNSEDSNYAGLYMFMGFHQGKAQFKHRNTRKYID